MPAFEEHATRLEVLIPGTYRWYRFSGRITDAGLLGCLRKAWAHPDYRFDRHELYDLTGADGVALTANGIRGVAEFNEGLFSGAPAFRSAILAGSDLLYAFSRVFEAYSGDRAPNVRPFRVRDEALAWLTGSGVEGGVRD